MDAKHFDRLARVLALSSARRGVVHFLAALPLSGALTMLLGDGEASADGSSAGIGGHRRRHRNRTASRHRKERNQREAKRRKQRRKARKKEARCQPESPAEPCAGRCGNVLNRCDEPVDCGPCCDPPCPACSSCDLETLTCQADPAMVGEPCGDGQVCQQDGRCACNGESCGGCRACGGDGQCVTVCACQSECCDGVCCPANDVCFDGSCCRRICGAVACGSGAPGTCGVANCGTCPSGGACIDGECEVVCGPGACPAGCGNCLASPTGTPICVTNTGTTCATPCQNDADCCGGGWCAAHPVACGGQFVCWNLGPPCAT